MSSLPKLTLTPNNHFHAGWLIGSLYNDKWPPQYPQEREELEAFMDGFQTAKETGYEACLTAIPRMLALGHLKAEWGWAKPNPVADPPYITDGRGRTW